LYDSWLPSGCTDLVLLVLAGDVLRMTPPVVELEASYEARKILPAKSAADMRHKNCRRTVAKLRSLTRLEIAVSEKQIPQVVENNGTRLTK